jgi:hypothetical protein
VALTYLTGAGIESGAGLAAILDVAEGQGIQLTHIPQPTDGSITTVRVYVSPANGDLLYQEIDIPVGITTVIVNYRRPGKQLETQWLRPMPRGHILRAYNGHLMVAHKNLVCWDEPYRYGLYDEAKGYTGYPERVALMEPIGEGSDSGGVFVASGKRTYFLSGNDPGKFRNALVHPYGAMEGTAARCDGAQLGLQYQGEVVVWIRSDGVYVAGMPSGQVVPIGQGRYATVLAERGASILRVQNGMRHILTTLMGTSHNGLRADDAPEATVYRNGVQVD